MSTRFRALISSDWNQCLSPCGPFDPLVYHYPELEPAIKKVFLDYTGNKISLSTALDKIRAFVSEPLSCSRMDAYLDTEFSLYPGVLELVKWCRKNEVAFMINTTGFMGYFQRLFDRGLFPVPDALAANKMIFYSNAECIPEITFELTETSDKGIFTAEVVRRLGLELNKVMVIGDSGGDGPHFQWAKHNGAVLVAAMAKQSLLAFCKSREIEIDFFIGPGGKNQGYRTTSGDADFLDLLPLLKEMVRR